MQPKPIQDVWTDGKRRDLALMVFAGNSMRWLMTGRSKGRQRPHVHGAWISLVANATLPIRILSCCSLLLLLNLGQVGEDLNLYSRYLNGHRLGWQWGHQWTIGGADQGPEILNRPETTPPVLQLIQLRSANGATTMPLVHMETDASPSLSIPPSTHDDHRASF